MFCKGKTKKGTDCCRSVKQGFEYCFQHVPKEGQEEGEPKPETKTESKFPKTPCNYPVGERCCRKFSYDGSGRCHIHKDRPLPQDIPPKPKPKPKPKPTNKAKSFCYHFDPYYGYCNNFAEPGSQYCKLHKQPFLCNYKFANGNWCNYYAKKGGKYCPLHSGDYGNYQAPPPPAQKTPATTILDSLKYFELPETTTYEDIKKKYRQLALKYHPDKGGNPEDFKTLQKHYDILTKKYNIKL